ncbi:hypothetical protein LJY18_21655 [Pseudomonas sp. MMS21-TM103]|uniref:hypothetical protein n=1 Tax=Pseudomonas sp. MMS21 TM103 TaxID=2886506 RepID=UPI001EDFEED5|nr:hypothetical protein [Pseudomonas sp. MMS21 TM103]MCG4455879.1 hypothetical protein [Pseudomonas sp. MMS21 TM103]
MNSQAESVRAQDLERRIRVYEEMEQANHWPGALSAVDYIAITLMTLVLVTGFYLWGY